MHVCRSHAAIYIETFPVQLPVTVVVSLYWYLYKLACILLIWNVLLTLRLSIGNHIDSDHDCAVHP